MKGKSLPEEAKKYSDILIEIQIASVLMHAWSEVEHDLVYKPYSGELSYEEYQILDELNGLVLAGEIALERLQKAVKNRVSEVGQEFNNHYELAMFLYNKLGSASEASRRNTVLGRVDLLFQCIKSSVYNKPESLKELIVHVDSDTRNKPVVDQIVDKIREKHPELYERYLDVKQSEELKYQLETLQMHRESGNLQGEANTLANIGYIYSSKENYEEAISYFTKAVQINHEIGGIQGEANQLLNLGSTYRLKGNLDQALEYCNQAVLLHQQINYKQGQANTLGVIGNIFSDNGNYDEAMKYYMDAIEIYRETNYKLGEALQLNNLGALYRKENDNRKALKCYQEALTISNSIEYKNAAEEAQREIDLIKHLKD
jgi:tetratricopeptide (TPR) repeat protein